MHYLIVATVRFLLATLILVGVAFFVLMGLLSILRELFADDDGSGEQPQLLDPKATGDFREASD